jgi:acetylornithine/N-succinyldiaminopimelate aminotransferase
MDNIIIVGGGRMDPLTHQEKLQRDPRIAQAKKLLLEAVKDQQKEILGIKPAIPELKISYEAAIKSFSHYRGAELFYPYLGSGFGKGMFVELLDGSVKYDCIVGVGVHQYGHNHPEIMSAVVDAAISNTVMQGGLQQNGDSLDLTELLLKESGMDHCFLNTTGAGSNENALKLAFQKKSPASRIIAFDKGFAGRSLVLLDVSDKYANRDGMPTFAQVDYVPYYDPSKPEESTQKAVDNLKKLIARYPKKHALMMFELIQGEAGCNPGSKEFYRSLMKILKENDIIVFADEVQTFGRTSKLFAYQHYEVAEYVDVVTIGKLGQVCATLYRKELKPRPNLIAATFTSSTAAIKASKTLIEMMIRDKFFGEDGKNLAVNKQFANNLDEIGKRYPNTIRGPYGVGGMVAFTPFDGNHDVVRQLNLALFEEGIISFNAGANPARIRFLPPVGVITPNDIDAICNTIEKVVKKRCT